MSKETQPYLSGEQEIEDCVPQTEAPPGDISILAVDDDPVILESLTEFLGRSGYLVASAGSGEEALEWMENRPVDLVLTDIVLPGMDGLALGERARSGFGADVMVMTGYANEYNYEQVVDRGASDFIEKPFRLEELRLRVRRVLRERRLRAAYEDALTECRRLAVTDGLTGLFNSRHFYRALDAELHRARRYNQPLSLILFDIDDFKAYNDRFGHVEGDGVLSSIARITGECLRKMDTAFRYGGEEFTVILPQAPGLDAVRVGDRIREAISAHVFSPNGVEARLAVSVGVAEHLPGEAPR
ncbi:MAG: diguanylate cyclase, partial [Proteobacteria bacterium]|nr:diguanylate cyclase [Pseudomonadota bacterium]